jgi:hypothetical protein
MRPVAGSICNRPARGPSSKSNMPRSEPATASAEPFPMRGNSQLSPMRRLIED